MDWAVWKIQRSSNPLQTFTQLLPCKCHGSACLATTTMVMGHLLMMPCQLIVPLMIRAVTSAPCIRSVSKVQLTKCIALSNGRELLCYAVDVKREANDDLSRDTDNTCFALTKITHALRSPTHPSLNDAKAVIMVSMSILWLLPSFAC